MQERTHTTPDGVEFTVKEVYRDAKGHVYYGFEDPLRMPAQRALAGEVAATWADLNLTKEDLDRYLLRIESLFDKGKIGDAIHIVKVMKGRLKWACEDKTLLNLAKVYYLIDDEPIMVPSDRHNRLKDERWEEDRDARAFFLRTAFVLTKGYSGFSANDILSYLEVQRVREARGEDVMEEPTKEASSGRTSEKPSKSGSTRSTSSSGSSRAKHRVR